MNVNNRKMMPWLVLLGIILIRGFATGLNTIAGLFLVPVSNELSVGIGTISLYFSVMSIVQVVWFGFAGKLLNKYDIRIVAAIATAFHALSFVAFGFMNHVFGWYLLAIPQSMGAAILVNLLGPILINRWFPEKTGIILGVQSACVGLFGAVLQPATSTIIADNGWRNAYLVMGLVAFAVMTVAILLFIKDRPIWQSNGGNGAAKSVKSSQDFGVSEKEATGSVSFLALVVLMLALTGVAVFVQHIPTYGNLLGYSMTQVGYAMSFSSVGTAFGALLIGFAADRIGGLKTSFVIIGVWLLAIVCFLLGGRGFSVFALGAFLNGISMPSIMVLSPILTLSFFGKRDYEKIYAKVSMGAPLASIFLVLVYGYIYDATKSYLPVLLILSGLLVLAGASIAYGWKKRCTK